MPANYVPAQDGEFNVWAQNFDATLTADPTAFGEDASTAAAVAAEVAAWTTAYDLAVNPATRTAPTVAAKDAARVTTESVIRPVAQRINANAAVTNQQRSDLGITIRSTVPTPVPPPVTVPTLALVSAIPGQHTLSFSDEATPTSKAKPFGVVAMELFRVIGVVPAVDPAQTGLIASITRSPTFVSTPVADSGSVATYFARWVTRSGPGGVAQPGPWSAPLNVIVM